MDRFITTKRVTLLIIVAFISSCTSSSFENNSYKVYYNPSIFQRPISQAEIQQLSLSLSSSDIDVQLIPYAVPSDLRKYIFENIELGKNNSPAFVNAPADFGIVNTYEFLDLLRYKNNLRPIAYFSTEGNNQKNTCSLDAEVIVPVNSPIKNLNELKGKKIATIYPEQKNLFPIKVFIIDNKISATNIKLADSVKNLKEMLANGDVDAALDSVYVYSQSTFRQGFFKKELAPNQKTEDIKYKLLYKTDYQFPCHLIYARKGIANEKVLAFLINLRNGIAQGKIPSLNIGKITSNINPNTIKRLASIAVEDLDLYQEPK